MLHRSDLQEKSTIQVLILRDWEKDKENLLIKLGGIDEKGLRNEDRIRQIEETIESLKTAPQDNNAGNHDKK